MQDVKVTYTEKEMDALEKLFENRGMPLSAKELGVHPAVLTSIYNKGKRYAGHPDAVIICRQDYVGTCECCGAKLAHKEYWID